MALQDEKWTKKRDSGLSRGKRQEKRESNRRKGHNEGMECRRGFIAKTYAKEQHKGTQRGQISD